MNGHSGQTESIWMATAKRPDYLPLAEPVRTDVCIVGAGIVGLTTAYMLCQAGRNVLVLEDGEILSGETERTTAHLSNALDDRYCALAWLHGEDGARLAAQSHTAAIYNIENIVQTENIKCDFTRLDGYLFVPPGDDRDILEREIKAAHDAGLTDVQWVDRVPWQDYDTGRALHFPRQAQFHPVKYLSGVAKAITRMGGVIHTGTHVTHIEEGETIRIDTESGFSVTANVVVVATNTPINDRVVMHTKQAAYRTYVIGAVIPKGSVPLGLYWDTPDPYHYVRIQPDKAPKGEEAVNDILIVGGEDHKTGQAADAEVRFSRLEAWARHRFPMMKEIKYRWSGQVMEPVDGMAFIGKNPLSKDNVFIATGDSGNGMTHGTIAGVLITDLIMGNYNQWAELYDPSRKTLRSIGEYAMQNLNVAAQYAEYVAAGEVKDVSEIPLDSGAIMREGLSRYAVYRDEKGALTTLSASCPHLGCVVMWNPVEKTWDCPCHGSRFDRYGAVLNGPAVTPLKNKDGEVRGHESNHRQ